jgi:hypothetical protein
MNKTAQIDLAKLLSNQPKQAVNPQMDLSKMIAQQNSGFRNINVQNSYTQAQNYLDEQNQNAVKPLVYNKKSCPDINSMSQEQLINFHSESQLQKELCENAADIALKEYYSKLTGKSEIYNLPNGVSIVDSVFNPKTNFKAVAYHVGDKIVICYAGTDVKSVQDLKADVNLALGANTKQLDNAREFFERNQSNFLGVPIETAGQSEGATEAIYVALLKDVPARTFNAYGLNEQVIQQVLQNKGTSYLNPDLVINYRNPIDIVSSHRQLPGQTFIFNKEYDFLDKLSPVQRVNAHRFEGMGEPLNSVFLNEYKKQNPKFKEHILNVDYRLDTYRRQLEKEYDEFIRNLLNGYS